MLSLDIKFIKLNKNMDEKIKIAIYILLLIVVIGCVAIIYGIISSVRYDKKIYDDVYNEYNELIQKEEVKDTEKIDPIETSKKFEEKMQEEDFSKNTIGILKISKLNISYPVIKETTEENLKVAPTKYCGPEIPNTVGNLCITGHNYGTSSFFSRLDELEVEDMVIFIPHDGQTKVYKVYEKNVVEPNDTNCLSQDTNGNIEITLITCTENTTKRLVVKCRAL